jgi:beta-galactosidase
MGNPPARIHRWRAAGLDRLQRVVESMRGVQVSAQEVIVTVAARLGVGDRVGDITSKVVYHIYGDGRIEVENTVDAAAHLPHLPRVGLELMLPRGFETMTWYGRGPCENYADRLRSALVGRYTSTIDEQFTPYVYTSESGGKEEVRWLALTNEGGTGLLIEGLAPLHVDALHYTIADLARSHHPHELTRLQETIVHLDAAHMGVGGDDGWLAPVHEEFLVPPGHYQFGVILCPLAAGEDPAMRCRERVREAI